MLPSSQGGHSAELMQSLLHLYTSVSCSYWFRCVTVWSPNPAVYGDYIITMGDPSELCCSSTCKTGSLPLESPWVRTGCWDLFMWSRCSSSLWARNAKYKCHPPTNSRTGLHLSLPEPYFICTFSMTSWELMVTPDMVLDHLLPSPV